MPISFKSPLSSQVANDTFLDKTIDDIKKGKLGLYKVDVSETGAVDDVQVYLNELADASGVAGEGDTASKDYSSTNYVANGDDRKVAIGKLDTQAKTNADNLQAHIDLATDAHDASAISYDNASSGLGSNNTQGAIDENAGNIQTNTDDITDIIDSIGQPEGICPLDANGEVAVGNLPQAAFDGLSPQGSWDASTNTPDIGALTPGIGDFWIVSVAGSTNLGGITTWGLNDWAIYTDAGWVRNVSSEVQSVNGQTGSVVLDKTDIGLSNVTDDTQLKRADNDWVSFTEKTEPVDDDIVLIEEVTTGAKKTVKLANLLGGGGGGGGSTAWIDGDVAPYNSFTNGLETKDFDYESGHEMFLNVIVPDFYKPGDQIFLKNTKFFANVASGNILLKCETTLIKDGESAITSTNTHTSTNTELTLTTANDLTSVGNIDLCDAVGEINSTAVAIGDLLIVKFYRDFINETVTAVEDAKVLKYSATVSFEG
jgi:hypothetical protein